jgi:hypothetical protein
MEPIYKIFSGFTEQDIVKKIQEVLIINVRHRRQRLYTTDKVW